MPSRFHLFALAVQSFRAFAGRAFSTLAKLREDLLKVPSVAFCLRQVRHKRGLKLRM